jgi:hypothetical protein
MAGSDSIRWYCPNRDCNWSFVAKVPVSEEQGPRCICGWTMKRGETVPVFHYLDFLREDSTIEETLRAGKK